MLCPLSPLQGVHRGYFYIHRRFLLRLTGKICHIAHREIFPATRPWKALSKREKDKWRALARELNAVVFDEEIHIQQLEKGTENNPI
jgi:hypothetical protein